MKFYDNIKKEHLFIFLIILTALILFSYFDFGYTGLAVKNTDSCTNQGYSCCLQGNGDGSYYFSLDDTCSVGKECWSSCQASYDKKSLVSGYSVFTDAFDAVKNFFTKLFRPSIGVQTGTGICRGTPDCGRFFDMDSCEFYNGQVSYICRFTTQCIEDLGCLSANNQDQCEHFGCTWTITEPSHLLTVTNVGNYGIVTGTGINCGPDCTESFLPGTQVALTATANPILNGVFTGWSGACSGIELVCLVTMDQAKFVTATFTQSGPFALAVTKQGTGQGTVTSTSVPGQINQINCGITCNAQSVSYDSGTLVTLTANAADGYTFTEWGGACSGTSTCIVSMTQVQSVIATFILIQGGCPLGQCVNSNTICNNGVPQACSSGQVCINNQCVTQTGTFTLSVTNSGNGFITGPGINCGTDCSENYLSGTSVTINENPNSGYIFTGW
ncbi:MAG: hypothetical protein AABW56_03075, partial [Nanoarchaeota archaeon]